MNHKLEQSQQNKGLIRPPVERKRGKGGAIDRARVLDRDNHLCVRCWEHGKGSVATEVDHVIPLTQGGLDTDLNKQSLCADCHQQKTFSEAHASAASEVPRYLRNPHGCPFYAAVGPITVRHVVPKGVKTSQIVSVYDIAAQLFGDYYRRTMPPEHKRAVLRVRNAAISRHFKDGYSQGPMLLRTPAGTFRERKLWEDLGGTVINWDMDLDACFEAVDKMDCSERMKWELKQDAQRWQ